MLVDYHESCLSNLRESLTILVVGIFITRIPVEGMPYSHNVHFNSSICIKLGKEIIERITGGRCF